MGVDSGRSGAASIQGSRRVAGRGDQTASTLPPCRALTSNGTETPVKVSTCAGATP